MWSGNWLIVAGYEVAEVHPDTPLLHPETSKRNRLTASAQQRGHEMTRHGKYAARLWMKVPRPWRSTSIDPRRPSSVYAVRLEPKGVFRAADTAGFSRRKVYMYASDRQEETTQDKDCALVQASKFST